MSTDFFKLVSIGPVNLELCLDLVEEDLVEFSIDLKSVEKISDLEPFLQEKRLQEKISLKSNSMAINMILFINRAFKVKTFIEYIVLNEYPLIEEAEFMKEILKNISEQNFLFIKPYSICEYIQNNLYLTITGPEGFLKSFQFAKNTEKPETRKGGKTDHKNPDNEGNEETEGKHVDEMEAIDVDAEGDHKNVLFDISYDYNSCDFLLIDLNDILQMKPYGITPNDLKEFLLSIFNSKIHIIINYPSIINNISIVQIDDIRLINDILTLTDTYIFEKKDALAYFTLLAHLREGSNGTASTNSRVEEKSLEMLFLKEIKRKRKVFPKVGIFIEEFTKVSLVEQEVETNLVLFHSDFEFDLYKYHNKVLSEKYVSHEELILADEYKKILLNNSQLLKASFLGGLLSRFIHKKSFDTCFKAGQESVIKLLEIIRQKIPFNNPNNFIVKVKKIKTEAKVSLAAEENKVKEGNFKLDCCNIINSKMKMYNPLYDDNLTSFFSSFTTRKHLQKKGFINRKGNILIDPDANNLGKPGSKHLVRVFENEKKRLNSIKDNNEKMKLQINNIFQRKEKSLKNVKTTDFKKFTAVNFNPITNKKLPALEYTWEQHPLSKKCGSTLYAANISTVKKQLKPISKDLYIKLLNNFENKAIKQLGGKGDQEQEEDTKANEEFYHEKAQLQNQNKGQTQGTNKTNTQGEANNTRTQKNELKTNPKQESKQEIKEISKPASSHRSNRNQVNEDKDIKDEVQETEKNSDDLIKNKISSKKTEENRSKEASKMSKNSKIEKDETVKEEEQLS